MLRIRLKMEGEPVVSRTGRIMPCTMLPGEQVDPVSLADFRSLQANKKSRVTYCSHAAF